MMREQEARHRHAEERDEAESSGVDPAVLAGRGDDAEADAEQRRQDVAGERQERACAGRRSATTSPTGLL